MTASFRLTPAPLEAPTPAATVAARKAANADLLQVTPRLSHVGRYQLVDCIGGDVHGRIYDAWDPLLDRGVTVKTLQFGLKMSARIAVDRQLLRAARAASRLSHRNIAAVLDSGLSAHGVYIATEHLTGQELERAAYEGWKPSTVEALKLARRVAAALAYAHSHGVVHGGLEPACIFVTELGRPKLLNFGLAHALQESDVAELAQVHLGSLAYRSPEQLVGDAAQPRSDLFSLGVVLYEMLAGRRAFTEDTPEDLLRAILEGPAAPLASLRPDLPDALLELVASAIAFEPDARPASAAEMASTLRRLERWEPATETAIATLPMAAGVMSARRGWTQRLSFVRKLLGLGARSLPVSTRVIPSAPAPAARQAVTVTASLRTPTQAAPLVSAVEASSA